VPQCTFASPLDHGPIRDWIAERNSQFDDISASFNRRQRDVAGNLEAWIAAGDVGDETGLTFKFDGHVEIASSSLFAIRYS
jgi:hypothetical protein